MPGKKAAAKGLLLLGGTCLALLALEGLAQAWATSVAGRGKLFEPDARLGWKVLPDLRLVRQNADGDPWTIVTDAHGNRPASAFRPGTRRALVLGDSFAFGEGVDVEDRFDSRIEAEHVEWSFVNLGVMGYGTDQQVIRLASHGSELRAGDALILVTFANDFHDLVLRRHSGRAKPWFELDGTGALVEHPCEISWREIVRDRSYLLARLFQAFDSREAFATADVRRAARVYHALLEQRVAPLGQRGVRVLVAFHGLAQLQDSGIRNEIGATLDEVCALPTLECLPLDRHLAADGEAFLTDGHWSPTGHRIVAQALGEWLAAGGDVYETGVSGTP